MCIELPIHNRFSKNDKAEELPSLCKQMPGKRSVDFRKHTLPTDESSFLWSWQLILRYRITCPYSSPAIYLSENPICILLKQRQGSLSFRHSTEWLSNIGRSGGRFGHCGGQFGWAESRQNLFHFVFSEHCRRLVSLCSHFATSAQLYNDFPQLFGC